MDSKEYVLNHDFGYGREPELDELKKLELRNIEDLIVYVDESLDNAFIDYQHNIISFLKDNVKVKVEVEEM